MTHPHRLVLIRGLPGSGKSTMAAQLAERGYAHFETDQFFERAGRYRFRAHMLPEAHAWCQDRVAVALEAGRSVVVANTFTRLWEMDAYLSMWPEVIVIEATGTWASVHGVPPAKVEDMRERWEPLEPAAGVTLMTVDELLATLPPQPAIGKGDDDDG